MSVGKPLPIGPTVIGSAPWRDSTMSGIKDNNKVIGRSDETVKFGRSVDPLPHLRLLFTIFREKLNDYITIQLPSFLLSDVCPRVQTCSVHVKCPIKTRGPAGILEDIGLYCFWSTQWLKWGGTGGLSPPLPPVLAFETPCNSMSPPFWIYKVLFYA